MLDLEITSHCNQRCKYCFVQALRDGAQLSLSDLKLILEEGTALGHQRVHLTGGEPLLHPQFLELLDLIEDSPYEEVVINTNGGLITPAVVQRLASLKKGVRLTISVDGFSREHDLNRGIGTHRAAIRGLERALEAGLRVSIFTVVTPKNLLSLPAFLLWLRTAYPNHENVSLIPIGDIHPDRRGDAARSERGLNAEELLEVGALSAAGILTGHSVTVLDFPLINLVYRAMDIPTTIFGSHCTACRGRLCVQADGTITPCHPCPEPLGTWSPGALGRAACSPLYESIRDRRFEGCRTCPDRELCGNCRASVLSKTGHVLSNDWSCVSLKAAIRANRTHLYKRVEALVSELSRPQPGTDNHQHLTEQKRSAPHVAV